MTNILEAIYNIVNKRDFKIKALYSGRNRANGMGDALENYIKDAFANTFSIPNDIERLKIFNQKFSWLGTQNNPPDIMIKNGDAIEVKKTQSATTSLALNSSYPKADLRSTSTMITKECRDCENWSVKDLIYCVGHTTDTDLKSLWMVYGNIYAAKFDSEAAIKTLEDGFFESGVECNKIFKGFGLVAFYRYGPNQLAHIDDNIAVKISYYLDLGF